MKIKTLNISLAEAKKWYNGNNEELKNLALRMFSKDELREIAYVKSWDEFCEQYNKIENEYYIDTRSKIINFDRKECPKRFPYTDRNLLATQEDAEAILVLIQLKRLRDAWWKILDYQPNWANEEEKYCIGICKNKITLETKIFSSTFLAFPTQDIRNQFFVSFQDLIRKAMPFLS